MINNDTITQMSETVLSVRLADLAGLMYSSMISALSQSGCPAWNC